jgi:lipoprotein-anchoring transpeptidase ErfK/SrfK
MPRSLFSPVAEISRRTPEGPTNIGIRGTDQPKLIPGEISHGCVRLRNTDILRPARLMAVGTPVIVR